MKHYTPFMLLLLATLLLGVASCSKTKKTVTAQLSQMTYDFNDGNGPHAIDYTYDAQGRCIQVQGYTNPRRITYTYTATQVIGLRYDSGATSPKDTIIYTLNGNGYAASNNAGSTFTYDADGHQTSIAHISGHVAINNWTGGNLTSVVNSVNGNMDTVNYTYTNIEEYRSNGLEWQNGEFSKNLVHSYSSGANSLHTFTHELDAQGRVIKSTDTFSGGEIIKYTYSYN